MEASSSSGIGEGQEGPYIGLPGQFKPTRRAKDARDESFRRLNSTNSPDSDEGDFDGDDEDDDESAPQRS